MENLTDQEIALLLATRTTDNAMSLSELAATAETSVDNAANTLALLTGKGILEPIEAFNGIVYGYCESDAAQAAYEDIHR